MAGKKQILALMWMKLMKNVDLEEPTSFHDHVYSGCIQRECKPNEKIIGQNYKMFESRISAVATDKRRAKTSAWSCDMEGHARKCVERYCELANKTTEQPHNVASPLFGGSPIKKEELENKDELSEICSHIVFACIWHELEDLTFCRQSTNWHELSQDGLKHVTDDWHDKFPTFLTQVITAIFVMWAMRLYIVDWGYFKIQILQETLKTQNQHQAKFCAFSETHSPTESEIMSLDAG